MTHPTHRFQNTILDNFSENSVIQGRIWESRVDESDSQDDYLAELFDTEHLLINRLSQPIGQKKPWFGDHLHIQAFRRAGTSGVDISGRLDQLMLDAKDEGINVNSGSKRGLLRFFADYGVKVRPKIVLCDNGNFRAIWEGQASGQLGVEFEGPSKVNYVILDGPKNDRFDKHYGQCTIGKLIKILTPFKFEHLI